MELVSAMSEQQQMDRLFDLFIQLQRGLEHYEWHVKLGNFQRNDTFEKQATSARNKISNAISDLNRFRNILKSYKLDTIESWMVSSEDIEFNPNNKSTALGRGGFGTVFRGKYYGQDVAVKRFDQILNTDSAALENMIAKEIKDWKDIPHEPYILTLLGVCSLISTPILVSELCQMNIRGYIRMRPDMLVPLVFQFACGLACIHKANIIHRDIKGDNVLVTYQHSVAIANFGLSRSVTSLQNSSSAVHVAGTLNWMSPEQYLRPRTVTSKSDVWSFGITLREILCDEIAFRDACEHEFKDEIFQCENDRPEKPEDLNPTHEPLWTLITKCWQLKPEARPSADEIVEYLKKEFGHVLEGL
ncbi:hypothetical protein AeMF1_018065 [Aphanomyces euteiches]|nr:hypothetical protein AeMF1_018065 [Aphanomyces euteiches]KAH9185195.1 hypothetical protein AeNC1_012828 [Aphanomyces euteiches]